MKREHGFPAGHPFPVHFFRHIAEDPVKKRCILDTVWVRCIVLSGIEEEQWYYTIAGGQAIRVA
jgi:hypothetical protein